MQVRDTVYRTRVSIDNWLYFRDCYEKNLIERDAFDENVARPSTVESEKRKTAPFEENESAKRLRVA